jgi:hypothetical protein
MAIRLERSGGLILIRGGADPPEKQGGHHHLGLWLALAVCVAGMLYASPLASGWPMVAHAVKGFVAAVW